MGSSNFKNFDSLVGKVLVANPYCSFGEIFEKSLIYIVAHSSQGALGLIVNKQIYSYDLQKLFKIDNDSSKIEHPIFIGGPIEPERSFVLHTSDYQKNILFEPNSTLLISSNIEIIKDILNDQGPEKYLITLGYTGWSMNQLENEIEGNYWLISDLEQELVFLKDNDQKWQQSVEKIIKTPNHFTSQMGHS